MDVYIVTNGHFAGDEIVGVFKTEAEAIEKAWHHYDTEAEHVVDVWCADFGGTVPQNILSLLADECPEEIARMRAESAGATESEQPTLFA